MGGVKLQDREIYKKGHVVDVDDTPLSVRTYMEQRDLRRCLNIVNSGKTIESAAEFGCGFGRMTQVLAEFTSDVTGLEREHLLIGDGRKYIPDVNFMRVDDLSNTGIETGKFDVIVTFTFLQHLTGKFVEQVANEMLRCLKPNGHIIMCEETDIHHMAGDPKNPNKICTIGRSIKQYERLFPSLNLIFSAKRKIERDYQREDTGDYMIFARA